MERRSVERTERGASLVEYALLLALIALVALMGLEFLGGELDESYTRSGSSMFVEP